MCLPPITATDGFCFVPRQAIAFSVPSPSILPSMLFTVYAAWFVVLVWVFVGAVSTICAVSAIFVIYAAIFCHVSVSLALIASTDRSVFPKFTRVPGDVYFSF
jgi:hypothetical protein